MKRLILFLALFLGFTGIILAQDVPVIPNFQDLIDNYGTYVATYLGIAGIGSFFAELLIRWRQIVKKWIKVTLLVVCTLAVAFITSLINIGYMADFPMWQVALEGGLAAAAAAGLRSTNLLFVKTIVDFLVGLIKAKKEPTT
jgi:hypothetical protein